MRDPLLDPARSMSTYAVRAPLVRHTGLETRFVDNGSWTSVRVTPGAGTTACLGMLFAMYLDLGFRRVGPGFGARPLIAAIDTVATGIDGRSARLREPGPGGLFANFHIVAEVPR